jgi:hypothetical protein
MEMVFIRRRGRREDGSNVTHCGWRSIVAGFEEVGAAQHGGLGEADTVQGATVATRSEHGRRGDGAGEREAKGVEGGDGQRAKWFVENDLGAESGGGVVDEATRDKQAEHFFEANGLGAELDVVVGPATGGAFFVFNRAGLGDAGGIDEKLKP